MHDEDCQHLLATPVISKHHGLPSREGDAAARPSTLRPAAPSVCVLLRPILLAASASTVRIIGW